MKKSIIWACLLFVLAGAASCKPVDPALKAARDYALKQDVYGAYNGATAGSEKAIFIFDEQKHQLAFNPVQHMFRIQSDDLSKLMQMTLDAAPVLGETRSLSLKTRGIPSMESKYQVEVIKLSPEDKKVWLLSHETLSSFVMYYE